MSNKYTDAFNGWWFSKTAEQRQVFIRNTIIGIVFVGFVVGSVYLDHRTEDKSPEKKLPKKTEIVAIDSSEKLLDKDILSQVQEAVKNETDKATSQLKDSLAALKPLGEQPATPMKSEVDINNSAGRTTLDIASRFPAPPTEQANANDEYSYRDTQGDNQAPEATTPVEEWRTLGGIASEQVSGEDYKKLIVNNTPAPSSKKVTLPVGFMKARLLVGINARSGEFGMNNPQQLVFLVQAPAQLPNKFKMNLAGCFAVTNASGDLSSGRIEALPVSMNCLTRDGKYIAEADKLTGFVQDRDGKRGLDARVVSRARQLLMSSLFARMIESFSTLNVSQGFVTSTSALGSTSSLKQDKLMGTAAAQGVSDAGSDLAKYLLELAKDTHPVMEQGPGKEVLLWLAKTTELEIKELKK